VICPFVEIGNNVSIGPGSVIGHHCVIKDHCFIGPHAVILGSAAVEPYCFIGANATIKDGGVIVARECIIGSGVSITGDTKERGVYINPPPELGPVPSNALSTWLTSSVKPHKRRPGH